MVHVVIAVGGEAADEGGVRFGGGEGGVLLVCGPGVWGGDRVVGFVVGCPVFRVFADDGGGVDVLAGGVFDFDDAGVWYSGVWIVDLDGGLPEAGFSGDGLAGDQLFF